MPLASSWRSRLPAARFTATAPMHHGYGHQWFSTEGNVLDPARIVAARDAFDAVVGDLVWREGLDHAYERVAFVGVSQGAVVALDAVASGRWPVGALVPPQTVSPAGKDIPILLVHGQSETTMASSLAAAQLGAAASRSNSPSRWVSVRPHHRRARIRHSSSSRRRWLSCNFRHPRSFPAMDDEHDEDHEKSSASETDSFPFERMTVARFRETFPKARWSDRLQAWTVPGSTARRRIDRWLASEADRKTPFEAEKGRDAFEFEPILSPYLVVHDRGLRVRTHYFRTVVDELRQVPFARWNGDDNVWEVPYSSYDELQQRWQAIEDAARWAEPSERRKRAEERRGTEEEAKAKRRTLERQKKRLPVSGEDLPPLGRPFGQDGAYRRWRSWFTRGPRTMNPPNTKKTANGGSRH